MLYLENTCLTQFLKYSSNKLTGKLVIEILSSNSRKSNNFDRNSIKNTLSKMEQWMNGNLKCIKFTGLFGL